MKALVIVPTYNEKDNITALLSSVLQKSDIIEILVIDDNSPDGTAQLVKAFMADESRVHLIERSGKLGLGSAYVKGFHYALAKDFDFILEMDADFSHNPDDIPRLLLEAQTSDLVIGSRYCEGINIINWPIKRLLMSYFASKYVRTITGMPIKDPTAGFKCFNRRVLESINLDSVLSDGYGFQVEINYRVWIKGFKIREIPVIFTERSNGVSKMSRRIAWEAAWMVWRLVLLRLLKAL